MSVYLEPCYFSLLQNYDPNYSEANLVPEDAIIN
jgi:hypothetical protein